MLAVPVVFLMLMLVGSVMPATLDFSVLGGIAEDPSTEVMWSNGALLNKTLNSLRQGDIFVVPNATFHTAGGILVTNKLLGVTIFLDGTLVFDDDRDTYPRDEGGHVLEHLQFNDLEDVTFTSSGGPDNRGTLNGQGKKWWGAIKYLKYAEDRPRLISIKNSKNIEFEKISMINSPFWTFWAQNCDGLVVRHSEIDARWDGVDRHTLLDLQAFNTDGFDVTGQYVHIHDVRVWNQDDCVCVKDNSQHMLFENIYASGLGLVVGSIGGSTVNNITFRNAVMDHTFKGIYMKTRWSDDPALGTAASISDILYENITIIEPEQFAIWIGPAQQEGQPCSLLWPEAPGAECHMSGYQTWTNITLRDITVVNPVASPGVILGNSTNPIRGLKLENVLFTDMKENLKPWGQDYYCESDGVADSDTSGGTTPVPACFQ